MVLNALYGSLIKPQELCVNLCEFLARALMNCLSQGLSDSEEMVICKTIEAMTTLCSENLFDRQTLLENISNLASFLVYPVRKHIHVKYVAYRG